MAVTHDTLPPPTLPPPTLPPRSRTAAPVPPAAGPPAPVGGPGPARHFGWVVTGLGLVVLGIALLGEIAEWWSLDWRAVIAAELVLVGAGIVANALRGRPAGGLVVVGALMTGALVVATSVDVPLRGGVGQRVVHPTTVAEVRDAHATAGQLTLDLRDLRVAGDVRVTGTVAFGQLVVLVPRGTPLRLVGHVSAGEISAVALRSESGVMTEARNGIGIDWTFTMNGFGAAADRLTVTASVGFGQVVVRHV